MAKAQKDQPIKVNAINARVTSTPFVLDKGTLSPLRAANAGQRHPKPNAKNDATRCAAEYSVWEGEEINAARARNKAESLRRDLPAGAIDRVVKVITTMIVACSNSEHLTTHLTGESSALSSLSDWATLL